MLAVAVGTLPRDAQDYAIEWKWDGVRALSYWDGRRLRLRSRNQNDITARYPELKFLTDALDSRTAVLDGEIVAFDEAGRPSFKELQRRMHVSDPRMVERLRAQVPIRYMIFDVLYFDGRSLIDEVYSRRREVLQDLPKSGPCWKITSAFPGHTHGHEMLEAARVNGLEGIIAKRLDGIYEPGRRSRAWLKIKVISRQEFVVGGWIPEVGAPARIGSMLLGYYDAANRLRYAGRVGTGLVAADHAMLGAHFARRLTGSNPFADADIPGRGINFIRPEIVVEVEYRRWPDEGSVQHAAYKGLRLDKDPRQVVREQAAGNQQKA